MDKTKAYKVVDEMVYGNEDTKFLEDEGNREIARKYIRSEMERGISYIYPIAEDKYPKLKEYLDKNAKTVLSGDFFEDLELSKSILGRFYLRNRNALMMGAGMDGPGKDKIWNASVYSMEMAKEYGPNLISYPGLENAIALAVKSIKGISDEKGLKVDDVISSYGDRIYKETGENDWSLSRFGPWHDKSFIFAKYMTTKAAFDSLPFYDVDYDCDHDMPEEFSPFHKGDEGQDFIVMIAQDKDQNSQNPYKRVFFDINKKDWADKHRPDFMDNKIKEQFTEAIKLYNRHEDFRVFLKDLR